MSCTYCGAEKVVAKHLCRACYYRLRRNGTLEYKRWHKPKRQCEFDNCTEPHVAKGLCQKHYLMKNKRGDPVSSFGYGERKSHPLYETWRYQIRCDRGRCKEWNDFWAFVEFAKEKPDGHKAYRYDTKKPWGPDNFHWKELIVAADSAERQRKRRVIKKLDSKDWALKRNFGITLDDYLNLYHAQECKCAICGKEGSYQNSVPGGKNTLAVDHCHSNRHIRGLLCSQCNRGLGCFSDSIEKLEKAIAYLSKEPAILK